MQAMVKLEIQAKNMRLTGGNYSKLLEKNITIYFGIFAFIFSASHVTAFRSRMSATNVAAQSSTVLELQGVSMNAVWKPDFFPHRS